MYPTSHCVILSTALEDTPHLELKSTLSIEKPALVSMTKQNSLNRIFIILSFQMVAYQVLLSLASAWTNARSMKYTTMVSVRTVRLQLMIFPTTIGHHPSIQISNINMTLFQKDLTSMVTLVQLKIVFIQLFISQLDSMLSLTVNLQPSQIF